MLAHKCPCTPLKMSLPQNETTVNLKSASFIIIMLLREGLTHIHSQKKPRLHFGESFTLKADTTNFIQCLQLPLEPQKALYCCFHMCSLLSKTLKHTSMC